MKKHKYVALLISVLLLYTPEFYGQQINNEAESPASTETNAPANKVFKKMAAHSAFKKGTYFAGGNVSFGEYEGDNDYIVANVDLLEVDKKGINVSFVGGYFINALTSVGVRGKYKHHKASQVMEADFLNLAFNASQYRTQSLTTGLEAHVFMRNYVPLGTSGNFYTFSETSLYFTRTNNYQRATRNPGLTDESISTILAETNGLGAGVSLGITYFSSRRFAFELQLGTTGIEVLWKDIEKDRFNKGTSRKINFRNGVSILNIQMGFTYYFNNI